MAQTKQKKNVEEKVGGHLRHSNHKLMEFLILGKVGGVAGLPPQTSKGHTLACLGDCLVEFLGRQSWKAKESRKDGIQERRHSNRLSPRAKR